MDCLHFTPIIQPLFHKLDKLIFIVSYSLFQTLKEKIFQHSHHALNFVEYPFTPMVLFYDRLDSSRYRSHSC